MQKIRPGYVVRVGALGVEEHEYWRLSQQICVSYTDHFGEAKAELIERLKTTIKQYVEDASRPIGVFLSGGLDSTAITALASREGIPLCAFSVGYSPTWRGDETQHAVVAARGLGIPIEVYRFSANDMKNIFDNVLFELPEPVADATLLPQFFLARYASRKVEVILDGNGADLLFGGSNKYLVNRYQQFYMRLPRWLRLGIIRPLSFALPSSRRWYVTDWIRKWQMFVSGCELPKEEIDLFWSRFLSQHQIARLLLPDWQEDEDVGKIYLQEHLRLGMDDVSNMSYMTLKCIIPWVELRKLSAIEQAVGISIRMPFLSPTLIEFGLRLPKSYKVQNGKGKVILREACVGLVPIHVLKRRKMNFNPPIGRWIIKEFRDVFWEIMSHNTGLFELKTVRNMMQEHIWGWRDWSSELWAIFVLQYWWIRNK